MKIKNLLSETPRHSPTEMHVFIVGVDALGDPFATNPIKTTVERIILIYKTFPLGKFLVLPFFKKVAKTPSKNS